MSAIAAARLRAVATESKRVSSPVTASTPTTPQPRSPLNSSEISETSSEQQELLPNLKFGSWHNEPHNIIEKSATGLTVRLEKHSTIAFLGCYYLSVLKGAVNINGANISSVSLDGQTRRVYPVYVPSSHPVLKIRALDHENHVRIISMRHPSPLTFLCSPFGDIWSAPSSAGPPWSFTTVCLPSQILL